MTSTKTTGAKTTGTASRRRPRLLALLALILWLAAAGVGGPLVGRLGSVQTNDSQSFLPDGAESTQVSRQLSDFRTQESLPLFITLEKDDGLARDDLSAAAAYARNLPAQSIPGLDGTLQDYLASDSPLAVIPSDDGWFGWTPNSDEEKASARS